MACLKNATPPVDDLVYINWNLNSNLTIVNGNDFRPIGSNALGWTRDFIPVGGVGEIRGKSHISIFGLDIFEDSVHYSDIGYGVWRNIEGWASEFNDNIAGNGLYVPEDTLLRVRTDGLLVHQEYSLDNGVTWIHFLEPLPQPNKKLYGKIATDPGEWLDSVYGKGFEVNYMEDFEPLIIDNYIYSGQLSKASNGIWEIPNSNGETSILTNYRLVDGCMIAFRYSGTDDYSVLGLRDGNTIGNPFLGLGGDGTDGLWGQQLGDYPNIDPGQIKAGDWVIMEYTDGGTAATRVIKAYKSSDGVTLTPLNTGDMQMNNVDPNSRVSAMLYSYNSRGGSRLYYPQGKGLMTVE